MGTISLDTARRQDTVAHTSMENTLYLWYTWKFQQPPWTQLFICLDAVHTILLSMLPPLCPWSGDAFVSIGQVLPQPLSLTIKLAPLYRRDAQDMPMPAHCAHCAHCAICNVHCAMCTLFTVQTPLKSPTTSDKASPLVYPSDPHFLHAFKTCNLCSMTQNLSSSLDLSIGVVFHRSDGWGIFWWYNHSKNQPGLILGAGILSRLRPVFDPLCSLCVGFWSIWGAGRMGG